MDLGLTRVNLMGKKPKNNLTQGTLFGLLEYANTRYHRLGYAWFLCDRLYRVGYVDRLSISYNYLGSCFVYYIPQLK